MNLDDIFKMLIKDETIDPSSNSFLEKAEGVLVDVKGRLNLPCPKKAILGIDVYRYGSLPRHVQPFIPSLLSSLRKISFAQLMNREPFIFQEHLADKKALIDAFIDTGDGGYQLFETPLHAVLYAIFFQANFLAYNSFKLWPYCRYITGNIELRYTLTYDDLYPIDGKYYGASIINNARIISKDKLNRFLMDDKSHEWFTTNMHGIENISVLKKSDFKYIPTFSSYKDSHESLFFGSEKKNIINIISSKLLELKAKSTQLTAFNLFMQVRLHYKQEGLTTFTITLGNLNTAGIE